MMDGSRMGHYGYMPYYQTRQYVGSQGPSDAKLRFEMKLYGSLIIDELDST